MNNIRTLIVGAAALLLAACGDNGGTDGKDDTQRQVTWKFAIEEIEGSVQHQYATRFKELVEKRSDGRIKVEVYPYGSLGTSSQITELTQLGSVQLAMASPGHLGSVIPEVQVFSLHYVFSDDETVNHEVLTGGGRLYSALEDAYREANLHLLGIFQEGWMVWTANRKLETPDDFNGLKIRTMNSPLLVKAYELYGANPTTMAYSEVYSGLQLNMIDAQVNPVFAIEEMSFYEVQSHMTMGRHLPFITTVATNTTWFDSLSDKDRKLLLDVKADLDDYVFEVQRKLNDERLDIITDKGDIEITRLNEAQREAFRKASLPIRDQYRELAGERGAEILEIILEEIEGAEAAGDRNEEEAKGEEEDTPETEETAS